MKKFLTAGLILPFLLCACGKQVPEFNLEAGSPEFDLAKELSATLEILDPEANAVLIRTDRFTVTAGELIQTIYFNTGSRSEQLKTLPVEQLKQLVLQNMELLGERKLLMGEADKAGIKVQPEQLEADLQQQYQRAGGEEQFRKMLEDNGVSYDYVRQSISDGIRIQNYLNTVLEEQLDVSEEELKEVYARDKTASVRHILLLTQGKEEAEKAQIRTRMEEILTRVRGGEDFAALAKEFSEDPGSKENGGLYEDFGRGRMVKPFEDAAFGVPIGEISDIVETGYGYHILKIENRKKETRPFDEVREELAREIRQGQETRVLQEHMALKKEEIHWTAVEI